MWDRYRYPDIIGKIQDNTDSRWIHSTSRTMQYKHTIQPLEIACVFTCLHWRHLSPSPWGVGQATSENEKTSHGWLGTLKRQVVFFLWSYIHWSVHHCGDSQNFGRETASWRVFHQAQLRSSTWRGPQDMESASGGLETSPWNLPTWNPAADDLRRDDFGMLRGCSMNVDFFHGCRTCKSIRYSDASTHELQPFTTLK